MDSGEIEPADLTDVLPVHMGIHTEDFNIKWFEKQTGLKVTGYQTPFFHEKYPYMYAHVDGLILDDDSMDSVYRAMMRLMNNSVEYMKYSQNAFLGRDRFDRKHYVREQTLIYEDIKKRVLEYKI